MFCEPIVSSHNPAYDFVVEQLQSKNPFFFLKLNHGFWERLESIESFGCPLDSLNKLTDEQIALLESKIGAYGTYFIGSGFLSELLNLFRNYNEESKNLYFASSLQPWPLSDRIEGTPFRPSDKCRSIIRRYVSASLIEECDRLQLTGYEFKQAIINGKLVRFLDSLESRKLIVLGNASNRAFFDSLSSYEVTFVEVHEQQARASRHELLDAVQSVLKGPANEPPIIIAMVGGALATWLGFKLQKIGAYCQYVDVGAAFYAFSAKEALNRNWMKVFRYQLSESIHNMNLVPKFSRLYPKQPNHRNIRFVEIAKSKGVPEPGPWNHHKSNNVSDEYGFLENKRYDINRIGQYLTISVDANHHANYGPVTQLLEEVVHDFLKLPSCRHVVAVSSGTAALHVAAAVNQILSGKENFQWATSRFSFFSAACGGLQKPLLIDCDDLGRLDSIELQKMSLDKYDGVVYTNVFSQHSDWEDIYQWCKANGKRMLVDNATGLLDRPAINYQEDAPIEIVSCHHTKPWGVGEGGLLICNEEEAIIARKLANFGVGLERWSRLGSNYKLSDLAAAAIIERLETMNHWQLFYALQERRVTSLVIDSGLPLVPLMGKTRALSPRAYTPFVGVGEVEIVNPEYQLLFRKYYKPLGEFDQEPFFYSRASDLYAKIVCISNNPFNRALSNDEYLSMLASSLRLKSGV